MTCAVPFDASMSAITTRAPVMRIVSPATRGCAARRAIYGPGRLTTSGVDAGTPSGYSAVTPRPSAHATSSSTLPPS